VNLEFCTDNQLLSWKLILDVFHLLANLELIHSHSIIEIIDNNLALLAILRSSKKQLLSLTRTKWKWYNWIFTQFQHYLPTWYNPHLNSTFLPTACYPWLLLKFKSHDLWYLALVYLECVEKLGSNEVICDVPDFDCCIFGSCHKVLYRLHRHAIHCRHLVLMHFLIIRFNQPHLLSIFVPTVDLTSCTSWNEPDFRTREVMSDY